MNLIKPPLFVCNHKNLGSHYLEDITDYITKHKLNLPEPILKSNELVIQINALRSAVNDFGVSLGLDISHKIPNENKFQIYTNKNYADVIVGVFGADEFSEGTEFITGDIAIRENDLSQVLGVMNHELVHLTGYLNLGVNLNKKEDSAQFYTKKKGYEHYESGKSFYHLFNEGITEIINLEIMKQEWKNHSCLKKHIEIYNENIGYEPIIKQIEKIITEMQKRIPGRDIRKEFIKNYFTGNTEPIQLMNQLFPYSKKEIAHMVPYSSIRL